MKDDTNDLSHIPARHEAIHERLEEWARWVRVRPTGWFTQPMFRLYQSKARQWDPTPYIHVEINSIAALEIERAVSKLPDKHRAAIRWAYIWPWMPIKKVKREMCMTHEALADLVVSGRNMVQNLTREKMLDMA